MNAEQIRTHAKIAAAYFQALLIEGVSSSDAVSLTGNYMISVWLNDNKPKEPWESE